MIESTLHDILQNMPISLFRSRRFINNRKNLRRLVQSILFVSNFQIIPTIRRQKDLQVNYGEVGGHSVAWFDVHGNSFSIFIEPTRTGCKNSSLR